MHMSAHIKTGRSDSTLKVHGLVYGGLTSLQWATTIKLYHDESDITRLYYSELMSACCHGHSDDMLMQSRCKADFCTFSQFVPMQMSLVEHVLVKAGDHMIIKVIKIHSKQGTEPNFIALLSVVWTCPLQMQERNLNHSILCLSLQKTSKATGELGRSKRQRCRLMPIALDKI